MTEHLGGTIFSGLRGRLVAAAAAVLLVQGCTTASMDEAAPSSGPAAASSLAADGVAGAPPQPSNGPRNTGTFPNLNIPPQAAAEQISAEQKAARFSELNAARSGQKAPPGSAGNEASKLRLRKLAASHATEALEEIEKN